MVGYLSSPSKFDCWIYVVRGGWIKGTQVPPGRFCRAVERRRFGNIFTRLAKRVRDLQPKSALRSFIIIDAENNPTLLALSCPIGG